MRQILFTIVLTAFVLSACGTPATPPPSPTNTPVPRPKAGHWEGEPSVSFNVLDSGVIQDFKMEVSITGLQSCQLELREILIETDNTFSIITSDDASKYHDTIATIEAFGAGIPTPAVTESSSGDLIEAQRILGKFENTESVSGTFSIQVCETGFTMPANQGSWNAAWKSP